LLPPLKDLRAVSQKVAREVGLQAIKDGLAEVNAAGLEKELAANFWEPVYEPYEHAEPDSKPIRGARVEARGSRDTLRQKAVGAR